MAIDTGHKGAHSPTRAQGNDKGITYEQFLALAKKSAPNAKEADVRKAYVNYVGSANGNTDDLNKAVASITTKVAPAAQKTQSATLVDRQLQNVLTDPQDPNSGKLVDERAKAKKAYDTAVKGGNATQIAAAKNTLDQFDTQIASAKSKLADDAGTTTTKAGASLASQFNARQVNLPNVYGALGGAAPSSSQLKQWMTTQVDPKTGKVFDPKDPDAVQRFINIAAQAAPNDPVNQSMVGAGGIMDHQTAKVSNGGKVGDGSSAVESRTGLAPKISVPLLTSEKQAANSLFADTSDQIRPDTSGHKRVDAVIATSARNGFADNWKLAAGVVAADGSQATVNPAYTQATGTRTADDAAVIDIAAKTKQYGSKVLAVIAHRYGDSVAQQVRQTGHLPTSVIADANVYLPKALVGVVAGTQAQSAVGGAATVTAGAGLGGNDSRATQELAAVLTPADQLTTPDPGAIQKAAKDAVSSLLLRDPGAGELDSMTASVTQAIMAAQSSNQTNIFASYGGPSSQDQGNKTEVPDPATSIEEKIKNSPEYKKLYAHMSAGTSEADYQTGFKNVATDVLGANAQAPNDAIRAGMESGDQHAEYGRLIGTSGAMDSQAGFRAKLFHSASIVNSVL